MTTEEEKRRYVEGIVMEVLRRLPQPPRTLDEARILHKFYKSIYKAMCSPTSPEEDVQRAAAAPKYSTPVLRVLKAAFIARMPKQPTPMEKQWIESWGLDAFGLMGKAPAHSFYIISYLGVNLIDVLLECREEAENNLSEEKQISADAFCYLKNLVFSALPQITTEPLSIKMNEICRDGTSKHTNECVELMISTLLGEIFW